MSDLPETYLAEREWAKTPLGKLFFRHCAALGRAWVTDQRESATKQSMDRDWSAAKKAEDELLTTIRALEINCERIRKLALEPSEEMVERAARAAFAEDEADRLAVSGIPVMAWETLGRQYQQHWKNRSRAVLRAFAEEIGR